MKQRRLALIALLGVCSWAAAESPFIGFRYDAEGFFPSDVTPPIDFDGVSGKNLLWKQPLPNFGNASPIVVPTANGGRVFVVIDQGYPLGDGDVPRLQCYHAVTGKLLWDHRLDPLDTVPETEAAPARRARNKFWEHQQALSRLYATFQRAETEEEMAAIREQARPHCGVRGLDDPLKRYFTTRKGNRWGGGAHWTMALSHPDCDLLVSGQWRELIGGVCWHWPGVGMGACTPISDGEAVYVLTGLRTLTKFDLDGNVLWHIWQKDAPLTEYYECWLMNALRILPIEIDGRPRRLLIQEYIDHLWAYDCDTGEVVWKAPSKCRGHVCGTPQLLRLARAEGGEEIVVLTRNGTFVRARDGKVLLSDLFAVSYEGPISDGRDRVWFRQIGGDGGHFTPQKGSPFSEKCAAALRFRLEGETLAYDRLLYTEAARSIRWPTDRGFYRDGELLTEDLDRVDPETGRVIEQGRLRRYNKSILAGGYFFGLPAMSPSPDAPKGKRIGEPGVDALVQCDIVLDGPRLPHVGTRRVEIIEADPRDPAQRHKRESVDRDYGRYVVQPVYLAVMRVLPNAERLDFLIKVVANPNPWHEFRHFATREIAAMRPTPRAGIQACLDRNDGWMLSSLRDAEPTADGVAACVAALDRDGLRMTLAERLLGWCRGGEREAINALDATWQATPAERDKVVEVLSRYEKALEGPARARALAVASAWQEQASEKQKAQIAGLLGRLGK